MFQILFEQVKLGLHISRFSLTDCSVIRQLLQLFPRSRQPLDGCTHIELFSLGMRLLIRRNKHPLAAANRFGALLKNSVTNGRVWARPPHCATILRLLNHQPLFAGLQREVPPWCTA